jgi:hypothetical protein
MGFCKVQVKYERLSSLAHDFVETAQRLGTLIISEAHLPRASKTLLPGVLFFVGVWSSFFSTSIKKFQLVAKLAVKNGLRWAFCSSLLWTGSIFMEVMHAP